MKKGKIKQKEFTETLPFTFIGNYIIIKVKIKGGEYRFLLDSGAPNIISNELAEKLKLTPTFSAEINDAGNNSSDLTFVTIDELQIGNIDFLNTGAAIADLNKTDFIYCLGIDGLIGANLMKEAIWRIDPENQEITLTNSVNSLHLSGGTKIAFKKNFNGSPLIDVSCNGELVQGVLIDLGFNGSIKIPTKVYSKMEDKQFPTIIGFGSTSSGLNGNFNPDTIRNAILPKFALDKLELKNEIVVFEKKSDRIGMEFLRDYTMVFNWFDKEVTLIGKKKTNTNLIKSFGFDYARIDKKMFVSFIYHNSNAQKMGLKIGDDILRINKVDFTDMSFDKFCDISNKDLLKSLDQLIIVLKRKGETIELQIEKTVLLE